MKPRISKVSEPMRFIVKGKYKCEGNISGVVFAMFADTRIEAYRKFENAYYTYTLSRDLSLSEYIRITEENGIK